MSDVQTRTSPIVAIAAVAVIIFSAVGVAVMTGVMPSSRSTEATAVQTPVAPVTPAPNVRSEPSAPHNSASSTVAQKPATRVAVNHPAAVANTPVAATPHAATTTPAAITPPATTPSVATQGATVPVAAAPTPTPVPTPPAPVRVCTECGVIDAINVVDQKGQGSGLGAVGGAVVGGLIGTQVGSGRGNTAATVLGAVGGALAGNEVEKRVKATKQYNVSVRMDDGNVRNLTLDTAPGYTVGEKVKVIDGKLVKG